MSQEEEFLNKLATDLIYRFPPNFDASRPLNPRVGRGR